MCGATIGKKEGITLNVQDVITTPSVTSETGCSMNG